MAKSLKQASKKAQFNNLIDNLVATVGEDKGAFSFNMNVLEEIVAEFIERVKTEINSISDFLVTGSIEELSIKVNNMNEVEILGLEHIIYQSRGVNGVEQNNGSVHSYGQYKPPVAPILEWIENRQLISANNGNFFKSAVFDDMTDTEKKTQLAYAIRSKIYKKGFQGKGYWDKNVDWLKNELNTRIQANLSSQVRYRIFNKYGDNIQKKQ
ncbi:MULTISPECIES: hypothetical protein [Sphingobacterium]|uniref:hypothetical protein n=1 Tax=Sphingobacterium TaxID=28453 RepID=UPI00257E66A7|nr:MULTISPECIES: hypothetical protein [Sphingobacterium]